MASNARALVAPSYLFACLLLGGSAQGLWQNLVLQLAGLALIAWAAASPGAAPLPPFARRFLAIVLAGLAVVALQLVPLPFALWSEIGPRGQLAAGYGLLGLRPAALPLSLTPFEGLSALLALVPPLALYSAMVRLKAYRSEWLALALVAAAAAGIVLGALQVASPSHLSSWYLYPETNFGSAVGFFANANHMGILLVVSFPFLAAFAALPRQTDRYVHSARLALVVGAALVILVGVALNGSFAAYGLALPVVAASALIAFRGSRRVRIWGSALAALLLVGAVVVLEVTPIGADVLTAQATTSVDSRQEIFATTKEAIADFMPFGSGLGSFRSVYHLYESAGQVTPTFVVHAHNDYLELALETGVPGILLMVLFLACWAAAAWRAWDSREARPFARAAAIASAAVLAHSLVDYPLRTAAVSALFAMCLALLTDRGAPPRDEEGQLRPTRHVRIG